VFASAAAAMPSTCVISDTLIGSLCREVDAIRHRSRQLALAMERCQNHCLLCRLKRELALLQQRRLTLLEMVRNWPRQGIRDPLALAFLLEMCQRPFMT
jgi:hypothetical protein